CFGLAEATLFAAGGATGMAPAVRAVRAEPLAAGWAEPVPAGEPGGRTLVGCGGAWLGQRLEVVDPDSPGGARGCAAGQVGRSGRTRACAPAAAPPSRWRPMARSGW